MGRLDRYLERRDFSATPEPSDAGAAPALALRYSIQKHAATRTHFDLRLEWDGALLSWAVTRGPSFHLGEKRLAVRTEDHPISYLEFEGNIPARHYGAGAVMLWDLGHWEPLTPVDKGLRKGHLEFRLHGVRLSGAWHLIRMNTKEKRENWLLTKQEDEVAGRRDPVTQYRRGVTSRRSLAEIRKDAPPVDLREGKRPRFAKPQLATLSDTLPEGDAWWHELKFDGYRGMVALGQGGPKAYTRNGKDWSDRFASLLPAFDDLPCDSALIDGEIVAGAGIQGFSALQDALKTGGPFRFYAFDLLERDGKDLTGAPLTDRRAELEDLWRGMSPLGRVQLSPIIERRPEQVFGDICSAGGEGLISKRIDAPYRHSRTKDWLKVKCELRDEFVILGWQPSDKRGRPFASLLLGANAGGEMRYVGKVGTGFSEDDMDRLIRAMRPLSRKTPPAEADPADTRDAQWITPRLVAEVQYAERTANGLLRHARYLGLREDKPAKDVEIDNDRSTEAVMDTDAGQSADKLTVAGLRISSGDRVVYPDAGITKAQVAEYYAALADRILPFAADRPLSLLRLPEGLKGETFFQKHAGKGFPDALREMALEESDGGTASYMYVTDAAGLVGAAQMGALELHIWGSRRDRLDRPDRMVFDLDPDPGLGFADVTAAASDLRDRLEALGLPSWPLLSGGKGVHVVVPLRRVAGWDTVKLYARIFATLLASEEPDRFVATMSKAKRKGRIFIDWLRNERGATAIAPYSLRARAGAPVAVPVRWDDLRGYDSAQVFDLPRVQAGDIPDPELPDPGSLTEPRISALEAALATAQEADD
ncbi:DNA ligase D [Pacificitalea manganoxidans]|uniref:DNA ligase (ATP) n=1 Tax=Pacificitalea manganoxidans TaxID=1411902 RepID=A0A291LYI5_9RHOB|nr:DNA ligase D [Pacificitalea manganoxidans]ATI41803.1 DNA ligase D [Pacificitalea manganoxidans]MDR6309273.1 bifunctional non-homologous end joining protein LigD [Pacificitalea manganoxidans]